MSGSLTARTIRDKVWKRMGLSSAELTEPTLDEALSAALTEYSRHRPKVVFGTLPILNGVSDYNFPTAGSPPVAVIDTLNEFYYSPQTILGNLTFEEELLMAIQGNIINLDFGGNIFENPTLVTIWFSKLKEFRAALGEPSWRVLEGNPNIIRLGSVPTQDGTAYFEGYGPWLVSQILPNDEEVFMKCVLWKAAEGRVMRISVVDDYYEYGGIRIRPATDFWQKKCLEFKEQFLQDVGYYRGVISVG